MELFCLLEAKKLEPKRLQFVHPSVEEEPNMVLVEALKGGGRELRILPPMLLQSLRKEAAEHKRVAEEKEGPAERNKGLGKGDEGANG